MVTPTGLVTCLLLASLVGPAQGQAADSRAPDVNTAGSLFSYFSNPVITSAPDAELTPQEALAVDSTFQETEALPAALVNQTDAGTAVPIGDEGESRTPGSQRLVEGNRSPLISSNDTQAATMSDQNRDLVFNNAQLKQENEDLWRQFEALLPQVNEAKQAEQALRTQSQTDIQSLLQENSAINARNAELRSLLQQLQSNYTQAQELLSSGRLEALQTAISEARSRNETLWSEASAIASELAALSNFTGQGIDYRSGSVYQYLLDKNQRMSDSGLNSDSSSSSREGSQESNRVPSAVVGVVQVQRTTGDSNDDNGDDLEASLDMVYVVALGCIFLLLQTLRVWLGYRLDSYMAEPLHALFVDVSLMVALAVVTAIINHMDWFDDDKIDLEKILYGFSLFILFWLLLGLWLILAGQSMARRWLHLESQCSDLLTLTQEYKQVYMRYLGQAQPRVSEGEFREARQTMQYAVMRQLFICPLYLPFPTEQLLRTDFNMGEYLARCMADTLTNTFQLTFIGLIAFIGAAGAWRAIVYGNFLVEIIFYMVIPVIILLTAVIVLVKLRNIYSDLVPYVYDPDSFTLPVGRGSSLANPGRIAQPRYLQGSLSELEHSQEAEINCACCAFKPLQLSCAYIFSGRLPSRHELLFWFDSFGPQFLQGLIQAICVVLASWMMIILFYYATNIYREWDWWAILVVTTAVVCLVITGCYLVPEALRWLTLTSKIEQLKDKEVCQAVVLQMKADRSLMMVKLYRQVKLVYREMNRGSGRSDMYALPDYMQEFVQEVFRLSCNPGEEVLPLERVEDALDLCGAKLSLDELRVFMWESDAVSAKQDKTRGVTLQGFLKAVQVIFNSVTLRPEVVARKVLRRYSRDVLGNEDPSTMTLADLEQFFNTYGWHFTQEDIQDFMQAAKHLANDDVVEVDEVADFVRDSVDTFAK